MSNPNFLDFIYYKGAFVLGEISKGMPAALYQLRIEYGKGTKVLTLMNLKSFRRFRKRIFLSPPKHGELRFTQEYQREIRGRHLPMNCKKIIILMLLIAIRVGRL